jgi:hypothetical protein
MMAEGLLNLPFEKAINKHFSDIKMLTAQDMLDQTWKGK